MEKYYLTKKGLERIQKEYKQLLSFREDKTRGETPAIWHSEDVNPEYLAFREDMILLDARLLEYENILQNVEVVRLPPKNRRGEIMIGATITLEEVGSGQINEYTLLGTLEANPAEGKISSNSPVGQALLGKKIKDEVVISSPIRVVYTVKKITYRYL